MELQKASVLSLHLNDDLIVLDEIQDLFPSTREKLSAEWQQFITKHGHKGLDILLMGQDEKDVHVIWRRRIQRIVVFNKQSAIGRENHYFWELQEAIRPETFRRVTSGSKPYDKKFYGLYKSHDDKTDNKANYYDKRAVIWNNGYFKYGLPVYAVIFYFAITSILDFFHVLEPEPEAVEVSILPPSVQEKPLLPPPEKKEVLKAADLSSIPKKMLYKPTDYVDGLLHDYSPRLSALMTGAGGKIVGYIDILDKTYHLKERLSFADIAALDWEIVEREYGVDLKKGDKLYVVTSWPLDSFGQVSQYTRYTPDITGK